MQRSQTLQLVRTLRVTSRPSTRSVASIPTGSPIPVADPSFPTGEEFLAKREAIKHHAAHTTSLWKNISLFACIPIIAGGTYWVYETEKKHAEHQAAHPHEYVEYSHLNRRTRQFPWGPNSLFFNPHTQKDMSEAS